MFLQGFRRKELDSFKRFCELDIFFFSFDYKISFEKIKFGSLIILCFWNFWNFLIINIFRKIFNCNFFTIINYFTFRRFRGRGSWNENCSIKNKIYNLKDKFKNAGRSLYGFTALSSLNGIYYHSVAFTYTFNVFSSHHEYCFL
jgi:hypothetical protein